MAVAQERHHHVRLHPWTRPVPDRPQVPALLFQPRRLPPLGQLHVLPPEKVRRQRLQFSPNLVANLRLAVHPRAEGRHPAQPSAEPPNASLRRHQRKAPFL